MKDGLPHGEMKVYNEKGKVTSIINYKMECKMVLQKTLMKMENL